MSLKEYIVARMRRFERTKEAPFINPNDSGLLFLQWLVTQYGRAELLDLEWHKKNQAKLRMDSKQSEYNVMNGHDMCYLHVGIREAVANGVEDANTLGYPNVVLSKSYMGGGRYYIDKFLVSSIFLLGVYRKLLCVSESHETTREVRCTVTLLNADVQQEGSKFDKASQMRRRRCE